MSTKPHKIRVTENMIINDMGIERVSNFFCEFDNDGDPLYGEIGAKPQVHRRFDHWWVGETDLSGVTVVVEHGFGLKSWYKNLSEAVVSVGDTVNRGDLIAYSGSTGFCDMASVQIDLTVFDVPVCPYSYWEAPVLLPNP